MITAEYEAMIEVAFKSLYGCAARYIETVPIIERYQGQVAWEGDVEVFDLVGCVIAKKGYAWADKQNGEIKIVAVLEVPPINSPHTAVQASIVQKVRERAKN